MAADAVIQNPDGTITVVKEEVFAGDVLNARLAELEVRAAAIRADPDCTATVEEAWSDPGGDLYARIVKQDSSPGVTFDPDAIPADRTLVLAAECDDRRSSRPPRLVMRVMIVRGPAPACVGEIFKRVRPLERFAVGGRRVVDRAREEARQLGHHTIEPEHILLGLLDEPQSRAAHVLNSLTIEVENVRARTVQACGSTKGLPTPPGLSAPFTPRAMQILQRAPDEATSLGSDQVASEHILLALVREPDGTAARILQEHGADPQTVRYEVIRLAD
jgi:Clp amino terminal domain, pathogenicity island component